MYRWIDVSLVESEFQWDTISNLGPFTAHPLSPTLIGQATQPHKDHGGDEDDNNDDDDDNNDDGDDDNGDDVANSCKQQNSKS